MTLIEVVRDLENINYESTIYAQEPWADTSLVIVALEPEKGGLPEEAKKLGLKYFIEVFIARNFLEDWEATLNRPATLQDKCARLIYFAVNDV